MCPRDSSGGENGNVGLGQGLWRRAVSNPKKLSSWKSLESRLEAIASRLEAINTSS